MTPDKEGLDSKLAIFDAQAEGAVDFLIGWLAKHRSDLIVMARGRHVWGHLRYRDRNYAEYDNDRLLCEAGEELADAINYIARRQHRLSAIA